MKNFLKWKRLFALLMCAALIMFVAAILLQDYKAAAVVLVLAGAFGILFLQFWKTLKTKGFETEMEISRVLGRDAKAALEFGEVGILTYNDEYRVTWQSNYFKEQNIDLVNQKITGWIEGTRALFEDQVDSVTGISDGQVYEIAKKPDAQVLFVKNITELYTLKSRLSQEELVVGIMSLDNYTEYQSYENEELLNVINTRMRTSMIAWARDNGILLRRIRSDRFMMVLDTAILNHIRKDNFTILQKIKDQADRLDVSITLSMVFAYGSHDYVLLGNMLNDLLEVVSSRGGDQVAIKRDGDKTIFIGGNSEKSSVRSKVRVNIVEGTIQDLIKESGKVFIVGHVNSDFDCMGAALGVSNWVKALGKEPYVVLKNVPRDKQLQNTMDAYKQTIDRHTMITPEDAKKLMDPNRDLVIMVDHGVPAISSGKELLEETKRVVVIDHHRRSDDFVDTPLMAYVESTASSTCELVAELLQSSSTSIPIYEGEATMMYLGLLVDTNRFKSHTSERTFQAAAALRSWGANAGFAEKVLQEDYDDYIRRTDLVSKALPYLDKFLIAKADNPISRTQLSQVSDSLLQIRGCQASFTIGVNEENGRTAISARSDGTYNVQKIMEQMNGGGHFSAAAVERADLTPVQAAELLKKLLKEEMEEE